MTLLKGLSLFANVGIAEAYMKELDVEIVVANEIDLERARFYQDVYPHTKMIAGDITQECVRDLLEKESRAHGVDFIMATPPCQGMSEAGLRKQFDHRNQLIEYAIDMIKRLFPKFVFLENVPKQLTTYIWYNGKPILIPDYIKSELGAYYNFNAETLVKAKDYGVPQLRERNIFLLVRKDIPFRWEFPEKQPEITLREAIGNLPSLDPLLREGLEETLRHFPDYLKKKEAGKKISPWHTPPTHSWRQVEWMMHTPTGKSAIYNNIFFPQKPNGTRIAAHHNNYRRLKWDMPCRTITQNNGVISSLACVHPGHEYRDEKNQILFSDARVLSIYELMIVTSLPLNWPIPSWANETFIRRVIGEGIPSKLVRAIMLQLTKQITDREVDYE